VLPIEGATLNERVGCWVRITNLGSQGDFTARVENVTNAVQAHTGRHLPGDYAVDRVAWVDRVEGRMPLGRREAGSLRLLEHAVVDSPGHQPAPVFYFLTAANETFNPSSHGVGWRLEPARLDAPIRFDLTVSNVTADTQATWALTIGYNDRTQVVFEVVSAPESEARAGATPEPHRQSAAVIPTLLLTTPR
jgi:hypothetical protein